MQWYIRRKYTACLRFVKELKQEKKYFQNFNNPGFQRTQCEQSPVESILVQE